MKIKSSLLQKFTVTGKRERYVHKQILFLCCFFVCGFATAFSSNDIKPIIFVHELGHYLIAGLMEVEATIHTVYTSIDVSSKDLSVNQYVRFFLAGYRLEIGIWYGVVLLFFIINVVRTAKTKPGVHFPIAFLPGYAVGTFNHLGGASDINAVASLLDIDTQQVVRNFVIRESLLIIGAVFLYALVLLYLAHKRANRPL
jgi:hypothetical protein